MYIQYRPTSNKILLLIKSIILNDYKYLATKSNTMLDMFCGSGNVSLSIKKYIQISYIVGVDVNISLIRRFRRSLISMNLKHKLFCLDAFRFKFNKKFDIIFIDPPFRFDLCSKILEVIYYRNLIEDDGLIIVQNFIKNKLIVNNFNVDKSIVLGKNQVVFLSKKDGI